MKDKTIIKEKKMVTKKQKINIFLTIIFTALSLLLGFLIAYFGKDSSFIETGLISAIITLFGFGLTSTVFAYQAFRDKETEKTRRLIRSLAKTLLLTLVLIIISLLFDFLSTVLLSYSALLIVKCLKNAALMYALICQIDILVSFVAIIKS